MPRNKDSLRTKAAACAALKPTISALGSPGPRVAATASILAGGDGCFPQGQAGGRYQIAEMLHRELRHDAAVFLVQPGLRRDDVGQDAALVNDRHTGLVA